MQVLRLSVSHKIGTFKKLLVTVWNQSTSVNIFSLRQRRGNLPTLTPTPPPLFLIQGDPENYGQN